VKERRTSERGAATAMANDAEELGLRLWNIFGDRKNTPTAAAVQSLVDKGAKVNTKDGDNGFSVLMNAVFHRHLVAVKTLLTVEGIDIYAKDKFQKTALMHACYTGNIEIVQALLEASKKTSNFDINDANRYETTFLMYPCMRSNVETTKLLLSIPQINTHLKSNSGQTALDYAEGTANEVEIRALFQGELLPFSAADKERSLTLTPLFSFWSHCSTTHPF
jgi:ankyrin repeat protein